MKRRSSWMAALALTLAGAGAAIAQPVRVVTTIFPLTDWARAVGGDRVEVTQLLPPGVEAHSYAPKPSDLLRVRRADVFIYLGPDMEPWAAALLRGAARKERVDIEAGRNIARHSEHNQDAEHDHDAEDHDAEHDHDAEDHDAEHEGMGGHNAGENVGEAGSAAAHAHAHSDPHIWLDPILAQRIVREIVEGLAAADPAGAETYRRNGEAYVGRLQALHEKLAEGLKDLKHRTILYGGHFAFGYFARRYGLEHRSPYRGFSPNAAPTPRAMTELMGALRESGQRAIFHEELLDPSVARVIAEQTGARIILLHGAHNLSKEEAQRGDLTYLSIMERNLDRLREGLAAP